MQRPLVTDEAWAAMQPLPSPERPKPKVEQPRCHEQVSLSGLILVLRLGILSRSYQASRATQG